MLKKWARKQTIIANGLRKGASTLLTRVPGGIKPWGQEQLCSPHSLKGKYSPSIFFSMDFSAPGGRFIYITVVPHYSVASFAPFLLLPDCHIQSSKTLLLWFLLWEGFCCQKLPMVSLSQNPGPAWSPCASLWISKPVLCQPSPRKAGHTVTVCTTQYPPIGLHHLCCLLFQRSLLM